MQHRQIVGIALDRIGIVLPLDQVEEAHEAQIMRLLDDVLALEQQEGAALHAGQGIRERAHHHALQVRRADQRRYLGQRKRKVGGDHHLGARILDEVGHFALGVERVEIHHDAADPQDREVAYDVVGRIGQAQADPGTLGYAEILQAPRRLARQLADLGISPLPAHEIHGRPLPVPLDRVVEQIGK